MLQRISVITAVLVVALSLSPGAASAHQLKGNHGYTAVMHIDPDDDPLAGQPTVVNFLIGRDNGSYNQNQYDIAVDISAEGQPTDHVVVEPEVFGNAADGIAKYTFAKVNVYTITLSGHRKTDTTDAFKMNFIVRVAGTAAVSSSGNATDVLILSGGSLVILAMAGYIGIVRGNRYSRKA